jgi:hypothetical protein
VAGELEQRWETALRALRQAEETLARRRAAAAPETLGADEEADFLALGHALPALWSEMAREEQKAMLRSLSKRGQETAIA